MSAQLNLISQSLPLKSLAVLQINLTSTLSIIGNWSLSFMRLMLPSYCHPSVTTQGIPCFLSAKLGSICLKEIPRCAQLRRKVNYETDALSTVQTSCPANDGSTLNLWTYICGQLGMCIILVLAGKELAFKIKN